MPAGSSESQGRASRRRRSAQDEVGDRRAQSVPRSESRSGTECGGSRRPVIVHSVSGSEHSHRPMTPLERSIAVDDTFRTGGGLRNFLVHLFEEQMVGSREVARRTPRTPRLPYMRRERAVKPFVREFDSARSLIPPAEFPPDDVSLRLEKGRSHRRENRFRVPCIVPVNQQPTQIGQ